MSKKNEGIGINPLHIRFFTNINNNEVKLLTRDMIHLEKEEDGEENTESTLEKENSSDYPFFTDSVFIPANKFINISRKKQLDILFNKLRFKKMIKSLGEPSKNPQDRAINAKENIITILNVLFPTSFPIRSNLRRTFSENIKQTVANMDIEDGNDIVSTLLEFFGEKELDFGYLKENSVYTVTKITVIDDLINDPFFKELINNGINFENWKIKKIEEIKKKISILQKDVTNIVNTIFDDFKKEINNENSSIGNLWEQIKKPGGPLNKTASQPRTLMVPIINELLKLNKENIDDIMNNFLKLYILNKRSSTQSPYIPSTLEDFGKNNQTFGTLLDNSFEYNVQKKFLTTLEDLSVASKILKKFKNKEEKEKNKQRNLVDKKVNEKILSLKEFESFLSLLKKYKSPNRTYGNNKLNAIMKNIGSNMNEFMQLLIFAKKLSGEEKPNSKLLSNSTMIDKLETGVMTVSEKADTEKKNILEEKKNQYYDVLINLECINGVVDNDNIESVKCPYRNLFLLALLDELKNIENKNPILFYNTIEAINMKDLENPQTPTQSGGYPNVKSARRKKTGGFNENKNKYYSLRSINYDKKKVKKEKRTKRNRRMYKSLTSEESVNKSLKRRKSLNNKFKTL